MIILLPLLALIVATKIEPVQPHNPEMQQTVAAFQETSTMLTQQFSDDLASLLKKCGKDCDSMEFTRTLESNVKIIVEKLSDAQDSAKAQLVKQAQDHGEINNVLGAAGDLTRSFFLIDAVSFHASSQLTESLSILNESQIGRKAMLATLRVLLRRLNEIIELPLGLVYIFTAHLKGSSTGFASIGGYALAGAPVTVTIVCGQTQQSQQTITNSNGRWSVSFSAVPLSGAMTCPMTATSYTQSISGNVKFL